MANGKACLVNPTSIKWGCGSNLRLRRSTAALEIETTFMVLPPSIPSIFGLTPNLIQFVGKGYGPCPIMGLRTSDESNGRIK